MQRTSELRKQEDGFKEKIKSLEEIIENLNTQIQDYADQLNRYSHDGEVETDKEEL